MNRRIRTGLVDAWYILLSIPTFPVWGFNWKLHPWTRRQYAKAFGFRPAWRPSKKEIAEVERQVAEEQEEYYQLRPKPGQSWNDVYGRDAGKIMDKLVYKRLLAQKLGRIPDDDYRGEYIYTPGL